MSAPRDSSWRAPKPSQTPTCSATSSNPLAALCARATLACSDLSDRSTIARSTIARSTIARSIIARSIINRTTIECVDYRHATPPRIQGQSLYIGNPPYVRHHELSQQDKQWLKSKARELGFQASGLAGLHVHFMVATATFMKPGDVGCLVTSSEWLDVNYGKLARELLTGPLGLVQLDVIDPRCQPFEDAMTTAVITGFRFGHDGKHVQHRRLERTEPGRCHDTPSRRVTRDQLRTTARWNSLLSPRRKRHSDQVELGELCRVHRGQVTGKNAVWLVGPDTPPLPDSVLLPCVTRASELIEACDKLQSIQSLRLAIDLPDDLDALEPLERAQVDQFLRWARHAGAHQTYIARHRAPWWAVRLRRPAPILATYMARRPPAFVRNLTQARHINIAHGLYPREPMSRAVLDALAAHLRHHVTIEQGRTYAGGLTKFEPGEMQRLLVPRPEVLRQMAREMSQDTPVHP